MNNVFCPKCYRELAISDWETDANSYYYRCRKECSEIEFRKLDNVCLQYSFDFEDDRYHIYGVLSHEGENDPRTILYDKYKKIVVLDVKHFIPVNIEETLPHQAERIVKRLKGLVIFK